MKIELERYLEDVESRLDDGQEARVLEEWMEWVHHKNASGPFEAAPRRPAPSALEWPHIAINDAIADDTLAIYRELEGVNDALAKGKSTILRVRANYGVGNVATAFGAETFVMPRETDTLPNVKALSEEAAAALIGRPLPDPEAGNMAGVARFARAWRDIQARYPRIGRFVRPEQPDLQGPVDNLELIMGSSAMFYAMWDEPERVHALLGVITAVIERAMDAWLAFFPENRSFANYFMQWEKGMICLRDDSAMNLSADMFTEYIAPYDGRLLKKYGGLVHFCGRGDHFIDRLARIEGLSAVNMSQPHLNDMEKVYAATIDRGIHLALTVPERPEAEGHDVRNLLWLP